MKYGRLRRTKQADIMKNFLRIRMRVIGSCPDLHESAFFNFGLFLFWRIGVSFDSFD
jgi:hypothetical protein